MARRGRRESNRGAVKRGHCARREAPAGASGRRQVVAGKCCLPDSRMRAPAERGRGVAPVPSATGVAAAFPASLLLLSKVRPVPEFRHTCTQLTQRPIASRFQEPSLLAVQTRSRLVDAVGLPRAALPPPWPSFILLCLFVGTSGPEKGQSRFQGIDRCSSKCGDD